jgi:hypothetical protein
MAGTAQDLYCDELLVARAKADFKASPAGAGFPCPLPPEMLPPIHMAKKRA